MSLFLPEGNLINTAENMSYIQSPEKLAEAMRKGKILEARALLCDRSHNHPMFGAVVSHLYTYLLGIRQAQGSVGYKELVIAPVLTSAVNVLEGYMDLPCGRVSLSYEKKDGVLDLVIRLPEGTCATLCLGGEKTPLSAGKSALRIALGEA